jgi:CheY-like chemotaxis protein
MQPLTKHLVIYVDDDDDDILFMQEALVNFPNIELVTFTDSYRFLKYIMDGKPFTRLPSVFLIDLNMPVLDGRDLLTMLRSYEELQKVYMAFYTTSGLAADNEFAKRLGAGFITKPVSKKQLNQTMQQLLIDCQILFG